MASSGSERLAWVLLGFFVGMNISVAIVLGVLGALYALVFVFFSLAARPLVRSLVDIPLVSLRLQGCVLSTVGAFAARLGRPLHPHWTLTFEISAKLMRFMFAQFGDVIAHENAAMMRAPFAMHGKMVLKSSCRAHGTRAEPLDANALDHMWLRDDSASPTSRRLVVIHYHGGGFAMSHPLQDVELANQTHSLLREALRDSYAIGDVAVDVLLANYRKAPEHPFPTPLDDCFAMYEHVLAKEGVSADHVLLSGDSAGGWMSIAICKRLRDAGRSAELPLACLLYSPLADFDEKGGDEKTPDCVLAAPFVDSVHNAFLKGLEGEARRQASPVNWDLTSLPPMFVQYGAIERFYEQGMRLKAVADKQGVTNWELDVLEGMPHDVAMFPTDVLPFAKEAIRHACVFAAKQAASVLEAEPEPEA
jgi:acetyl esterase/lipase